MWKNLLILAFVFFSGILPSYVKAQTPAQVLTSDLGVPYTMECVEVSGTGDGWPPVVASATFTGTCSSPNGCNIGICGPSCEKVGKVEGGINSDCYGKTCTVYDPELDVKYFGQVGGGLPNVTVNTATPHRFPPGQFKINGAIANPGDHVTYDVYAVSEPDLGTVGGEGKDPSQQLDKTEFVFSGSREACNSIFWDPYGRVFDAVSLEPLGKNDAKVTLLDDKDQYVNVPSNNSPIDALGKYNIFIEKDGLYKLSVSGMASHEFVTVSPNPKYVDLYERIYRKGDPAFEEKQTDPQRYDLAVKPKGKPLSRDIETISKDQILIWMEGKEYAKINLRFSHPLTKIESNFAGLTCEQTKADHTDKEGHCTIIMDVSDIPQEGLEATKIKNPEYYLSYDRSLIKDFVAGLFSLVSGDVSAQQRIRIEIPVDASPVSASETIAFEPILRHVEGYAYDESGKTIPKAKVQVVLTMNNKVFYQTTADDSGFFTIYKSNLPPLEYDLKIIDPSTSKSFTQTTSLFIKNNQAYIDSEKINLMAITKNGQPIVNPATGKLNEIVKTEKTTPKDPFVNSGKSAVDFKILSVFVILFVLVALTVGTVFYIKQSRPQIP